MLQVNRVLPAAEARLATIRNDALLMDAARLLSESRINLVVVCGMDGELAGVIKQTALDYSLMSAYTAFLAVDATARTAGSHGTTVHQALPMPDGVRYETTVPE